MQVSVEATKGLERKMTVHVPAERVENEVDGRLKRLGRTARIKGFRPGKVPFSVVRQQYGPQVREEVLQELLRQSYGEALQQEKLHPAGQPAIDPVSMEPGEGLRYTATFEVYPEVTLKKTEGLKIERATAEVADSDVDAMIGKMRRQRGAWEKVERAAKTGDRVVIDFEGKLKGEDFPGNRGEKMPVELGEGRMVEDFEKNLAGVAAGEEKTFDVKFPKDYHADDLKGQKVKFSVKVHEVQELALPELDEEFCRQFGVADGGIEKLREDVRAHMQRELESALRKQGKEQLLDALVDANKVDLPNALVDEEIHTMQHDMAKRMGMGDKADPHQLPRDLFEERARKRVALGLLLGEFIKSRELKPSKEKVGELLQDAAANYPDPAEAIRSYQQNPQVMRQVEAMALEEQAVDLLLEKATIKEKAASFDEVMNAGQ
ncbi:MAG TPA: trigger factor [Gammaproteobacteria bacterium]